MRVENKTFSMIETLTRQTVIFLSHFQRFWRTTDWTLNKWRHWRAWRECSPTWRSSAARPPPSSWSSSPWPSSSSTSTPSSPSTRRSRGQDLYPTVLQWSIIHREDMRCGDTFLTCKCVLLFLSVSYIQRI